MKKIECEIIGVTPLLMNSPHAMLEESESVVQRGKKKDYKKEAKAVEYRNKSGKLYVPATAIKGTILNASAFKKVPKMGALRRIVAGGVRVIEDELILNKQKYKIDLRTVVNRSRGRIVKARPKIEDWKLKFHLEYNENLIAEPSIILKLLEEAGERIGILDFRPDKNGEFGCFKVTKFKPL